MHARKRGVERFEKLSREGKITRKVWVWKRKKEIKKEKKNICEWKKKEEKEKEKRGGSKKDMRGMDQVKETKNKV
jgi:hypothetical protein